VGSSEAFGIDGYEQVDDVPAASFTVSALVAANYTVELVDQFRVAFGFKSILTARIMSLSSMRRLSNTDARESSVALGDAAYKPKNVRALAVVVLAMSSYDTSGLVDW
jgi:hypothetical protein